MSYPPEHKQETRRRIVEGARRLFRCHGYDGVGIDAIMAEAGLTRGGFYAHFPSKDALFAASLGDADTPVEAPARGAAATDEPQSLEEIIAVYLSRGHCDHPEMGCPIPALSGDVSRAGGTVRARFDALVHGGVARLMKAARCSGGRANKRAAYATLAQMVGGVVLARAVGDDRLADEILSASRGAALSNAGLGRRRAGTRRKTP